MTKYANKLTKLYKRRLKPKFDGYSVETGFNSLADYLKYLRDMTIVNNPLPADGKFGIDMSALLTAIDEFEAYKFYSDTVKTITASIADAVDKSTEGLKAQEVMLEPVKAAAQEHFNNFISLTTAYAEKWSSHDFTL